MNLPRCVPPFSSLFAPVGGGNARVRPLRASRPTGGSVSVVKPGGVPCQGLRDFVGRRMQHGVGCDEVCSAGELTRGVGAAQMFSILRMVMLVRLPSSRIFFDAAHFNFGG